MSRQRQTRAAPRGSGGPRGGILFEAFMALTVVALGAAAWFFWTSRPSAPIRKDAQAVSAWLQSETRGAFVRHGVGDAHVLKTYNRARRQRGVEWVEGTLEVRAPADFHPGRFSKDLSSLLAQKDLVVLREEKTPGQWRLDLGADGRVFQRVIIHGRFDAHRAAGPRPAGRGRHV
jgi:hypothetical protein